ncbi:MAG: hypothetical protein EOP45_17575 [Sphingobacteriaceae bacterium]|nr:MAG: hypothetical protein EOP45_17575 [Sphingobacteriaceae bacterium]
MKTEIISIEITWDDEAGHCENSFKIPGEIPVVAILLGLDKIKKTITQLTVNHIGIELFDGENEMPFDKLENLTFAEIVPSEG